MKQTVAILTLVAASKLALAQPTGDPPTADPPSPDPPTNPTAPDGTPVAPPSSTTPTSTDPFAPVPMPTDQQRPQQPARPEPPPAPRPIFGMPEALTTPTGWLLPAAVFYTKTAIDTGGGVTNDTRVGLGEVAEFGVATIDSVRERTTLAVPAERIQPYLTASFRLGVAEQRFSRYMPGMTLGFRKSFEREHAGHTTRIAELSFAASKHFGEKVALTGGAVFWDAAVRTGDDPEVSLHGFDNKRQQFRPFASLQAEPIARSQILIDVGWAPEFCYECTGRNQIRLRPVLSWGVRYEVVSWMRLESGVRVADIGEANLLDAQIFGGLTLTSWAFRRAVDSLK